MGNHVLEYVIKLTDRVSTVAEKVADGVKRMASRVSGSMNDAAQSVESGNKRIEEKFIHTEHVLDMMGKAYENLGVKGKDFADAMDVLERRLDNFNRTGEGSEELFEHLKLSLEDFGATSKQVDQGLAMLKDSMVKVGKSADEASGTGVKGFNALRLTTAALHGNVGQVAAQVARLIPAFQKMGSAGTMAVFAVGGAITGIIKLVGALAGLFKTAFNLGNLDRDLVSAKNSLEDMKTSAENFYEQIEEARKQGHEMARQYEEITKAINDATKAQNAFNREQELANAKSGEEREAIRQKYARKDKVSDEATEAALLKSRRKELQEERDRLNAELAQAMSDQEGYLLKGRKFNRIANREKQGVVGQYASEIGNVMSLRFRTTGNDKALAAANAAGEAYNAYDEAVAKEEEIRKKIAENEHKLKVLHIEEEAQKTKAATSKQQAENEANLRKTKEEEKKAKEEQKRLKQEERELAKEIARIEREAAAEQKRLQKELAAEKKRLERELADQRKEEIRAQREAVRAAAEEERAAQRRLTEANRKVDEAWGFYKDRDSLAAHDAGVDADVAAKGQYAKDLHTLEHGRDSGKYAHLKYLADHKGDQAVEEQLSEWRRKKSISVDSEATMRVALANREQAGAADYAKQTAEATQAARDYLETISEAVTSGGEE